MSEEFTVVVQFETTPENHEEAVSLIGNYIATFLSQQPGFIESWLNEKTEGRGLLHFARWQCEEDFRAVGEKAQNHPDLPAIRQYQPSANFYRCRSAYGSA